MRNKTAFSPDRVSGYFRMEWRALAPVTVSGLIYNVGLLAEPWFEGRLARRFRFPPRSRTLTALRWRARFPRRRKR